MTEKIEESHNTKEYFQKMVDKGDIEFCSNCLQYSAYAYEDVNMTDNKERFTNEDGFKDGNEAYTDEEVLTNWPDVYNIGACSCAEWKCGNCDTYWVEKNSVYNNFGHRED